MSRPAVFLDRDGTLIEERSYLTRPEQVRLLAGTTSALIRLRAAGFACVVVTNQSAIGRGMMTEADLSRVHQELHRQLRAEGAAVDAIYHCPLAPSGSDKTVIEHPDRKPGPGMLLRAARELDLDVARSWMVGDGICDVLAGRNAGCRGSILVRTGHAIDDVVALLAARQSSADELESRLQPVVAPAEAGTPTRRPTPAERLGPNDLIVDDLAAGADYILGAASSAFTAA